MVGTWMHLILRCARFVSYFIVLTCSCYFIYTCMSVLNKCFDIIILLGTWIIGQNWNQWTNLGVDLVCQELFLLLIAELVKWFRNRFSFWAQVFCSSLYEVGYTKNNSVLEWVPALLAWIFELCDAPGVCSSFKTHSNYVTCLSCQWESLWTAVQLKCLL